MVRVLRRFVPRAGFLTAAGLAWAHRGTVVRLVDLAVDSPRLVREDGPAGLARHGRLLFELDRALPTDVGVRISGMDDGSVTLAGDPGAASLARAREALCGKAGVLDVRTDGTSHPVVTAAAGAGG